MRSGMISNASNDIWSRPGPSLSGKNNFSGLCSANWAAISLKGKALRLQVHSGYSVLP